jgi:hypothetical protein
LNYILFNKDFEFFLSKALLTRVDVKTQHFITKTQKELKQIFYESEEIYSKFFYYGPKKIQIKLYETTEVGGNIRKNQKERESCSTITIKPLFNYLIPEYHFYCPYSYLDIDREQEYQLNIELSFRSERVRHLAMLLNIGGANVNELKYFKQFKEMYQQQYNFYLKKLPETELTSGLIKEEIILIDLNNDIFKIINYQQNTFLIWFLIFFISKKDNSLNVQNIKELVQFFSQANGKSILFEKKCLKILRTETLKNNEKEVFTFIKGILLFTFCKQWS